MTQPLKVLVTGCNGRMGKAVIDCSESHDAIEVAKKIDVGDCVASALEKCDSVIDFSFHTFTCQLIEDCVKQNKPAVIGTTGHTDEEIQAINEAAESIPLVMSPNFSIGVNTLFWLTGKTAETLGKGYDLEVIEMHHRLKQDAPSGTAKHLAEILAEKTGLSYNEHTLHGRQGIIGPRTDDEIGMHSMRGGDVIGDHTVIYAASGERIELTHKASSRNTFANGALRASDWLKDQSPGLYDMQDVLGLRS
ncbi:MAG: 4-hydroxy-tetrahydrodipicolinate reductase [Verrucomicrobiales bacterium]|nr:4-hydroxy-tetrahydrodipicolinate reductase [Verrucomicrobiales bacterium]